MVRKEKNKGITLITLVIMIVVLLILAGISISMLTGQNGILKRTNEAKIKTQIATIEEQANLIYTNLLVEEYAGDERKPTLEDIMEKLNEYGYEIVQVATSESSVTGIKLSANTLILEPGEEKEIVVTLEGDSSGYSYYAVVDGNNYLMTLESNGITIADTKSEVEVSESEIKVQSDNENVTVEVEGNKVIVTAGSLATEITTITVSYGTFTQNCDVAIVIKPTESSQADSSVTFDKGFGKIEVIWLDTENNIIESPEIPKIQTGMEKVTWTKNGDTWIEDQIPQTEWYKYVAKEGTGGNNSSKWANIKIDGSYFVWIPRYAYRITYYASIDSTIPTGFSDGWGIWRASDGKIQNKITNDIGIETVEYNGNKYIVHPAFCNGIDNSFKNGEWNADLAGIWVAKFEASEKDATTPKFEPGKSSWRSIDIGTMFTNSKNFDPELNSHLMKNSEWGAVVYLTHSQYGRNGTEVTINNNSNYITGNAGNSTDDSESTTTNAYNTEKGVLASSTENVYGIYDLSGSAWEYVAGYYSGAESDYLNSGSSFTSTKTSDQYSTVYNGTSYSSSFIYGDATYETAGWFSDYVDFVDSKVPFFLRGGHYNDETLAGAFYFNKGSGYSYSYSGFRACLALQ